jgi:hypothetical protein
MRFASILAAAAACVAFAATAAAATYRYPIEDPDGTHVMTFMVIGVDHDPVDQGSPNIHCLAYDCATDFPYCYDQHDGTDFPLDGGFDAMDAGSLPIVAAAPGEVIAVADGNYDRCHADLSSGAVSCDGHPMKSNHVKVKHADGFVTAYHHMLKGSVLPKVGDVVACGQALGLVGSSGNSAMPHLHFEVMRPDGSVVDPYAGACSQPESWWVVQDGPYGLPGPWCEGEPIPEWGEAPAAEDVPEEVAAVESAPEEPAVEEPAAEEPAIEEPAVAEEVVVSDEPMLDAFGPDGGAGEPAVVSARQVGCTTGGRTTPAAVGWLLLAVLVALRVATSGPRTWRSRPRGWPAPGRGDRTPSRS